MVLCNRIWSLSSMLLNILLINSLFFYNIMYIYFLKKPCLCFNFSISMNGIILYTFFLFLSLLQFLRFIQMMHSVAVYSFHCWMLIQCEIIQQFIYINILNWWLLVGWLFWLWPALGALSVFHYCEHTAGFCTWLLEHTCSDSVLHLKTYT